MKIKISLNHLEKPIIQVYICFVMVLFGWTAYNFARFPYGIDYGEAPLMDQARRIENHEALYKANINEPPYIVTNYPPLYPISIAFVNTVFNLPLFQAGRLISIFFTLISGAVIGFLGYKLTNHKLLGALSAAIFLGNPYVLIWSSIARVDMMALAFSLLGLWALYQSRKSSYWLLAACVFFVISIYTRQTYLLAGPLAGLIWLWYVNKRRAIIFIFSIGIPCLLLFGMINALTLGGFFTNIIVANNNQYVLSRMAQMIKQLLSFWPVILIIAVISFAILVRSFMNDKVTNDRGQNKVGFMVYGLGGYSLGAIISALTVGKVGSDINYFLELISICSLWCAIGINYIMTQKKAIQYLFFCILFFQLIWASIAGVVLIRQVIEPKLVDLPLYNTMFTRVKEATQVGTVLSDDYLDMVVLSGQPIYYQPFEYGQLYQADLWDPSQFILDINHHLFPMILIGGDTINKPCCWPTPIVTALEANYIVSKSKLGNELTLK